MSEHNQERPRPEDSKQAPVKQAPHETEPAQEWGERLTQGKAIARGGKTSGEVPGAEETNK